MKKAVLIIGGITLVLLAGLIGMMYYIFSKAENDKNKSRTEAAREARWKNKSEALIVTDEGVIENTNQN